MNLFYKKKIRFRTVIFYPSFTLGTPTSVTIFLNRNIFLPRITGPACTINIYKTFQNVFVRNLGMSIWLSLYKHFDCYPNAE